MTPALAVEDLRRVTREFVFLPKGGRIRILSFPPAQRATGAQWPRCSGGAPRRRLQATPVRPPRGLARDADTQDSRGGRHRWRLLLTLSQQASAQTGMHIDWLNRLAAPAGWDARNFLLKLLLCFALALDQPVPQLQRRVTVLFSTANRLQNRAVLVSSHRANSRIDWPPSTAPSPAPFMKNVRICFSDHRATSSSSSRTTLKRSTNT